LAEIPKDKADLKRAEELAKNALIRHPGDPALLDTLGWVEYRMGNYNQAADLIENALKAAPDEAILNYHMGMVHLKNGQMVAAREKLKKALDNKSDFYGRDIAEQTLKELG